MKTAVLIACCSKKLDKESNVRDIYISSLFKKSYEYAKTFNPDYIFVLSAKYGLLKLNEVIKPYNETLNNKSLSYRKEWANNVLIKLEEYINLNNDKVIFLAGNNYRKHLIIKIRNYEIPMQGLGIGKQLRFLKENI